MSIELFSQGTNYTLYKGSMLDMLEVIQPCSIDSIVTDPPYELNFMNKGWDNSGIAFKATTWKRCFDALKPGGYLLAFGGSRTYHRIACAIEDAGFEIRDTIMWLYGSGFPKSMNIGLAIDKKNGVESEVVGYLDSTMPDFIDAGKKNSVNKIGINDGESADRIKQLIYRAQNEWDGWGTALKPAYEPIIVARKPCEGSATDNVLKYGVGGINIDECRIPMNSDDFDKLQAKSSKNPTNNYNNNPAKKYGDYNLNIATKPSEDGRFPSNVILTYDETDEKEVCGGMLSDEGSAARYFYCAKASNRDRDEGLHEFMEQRKSGYGYDKGYMNAGEGMFKERQTLKRNIHPTVKPTLLMEYLVRLVTPKGGTVLDPFNGSGSTGKATMYENCDRCADYKYIGIELSEEYLAISNARIGYAAKDVAPVAVPTKPITKGTVKHSLF